MAGGPRSRKASAAEGSTEAPGKSKGRKLSKVPEAEMPVSPSTTVDSRRQNHDKVSKSRVSSCFAKSDPGSSRATTQEAVPSTPVSACFKPPQAGRGDMPPGFRSSSTRDPVPPGEDRKLMKGCYKCGEVGHSGFSCSKEREVQQPSVGDASKAAAATAAAAAAAAAAAIKTRLTDEEREECRRLKKCYTCGESGHPYFKCPQEEKRLHAIQAEKDSKLSTKLWREPCWMYKSANGQSQGPYTLSRLATKLHEASFSSHCEVTHLHKKISMSLGKIMESADDGTLVTLLNGRPEPAIQKVEVNASKDNVLYAVQTKLHSEVVQITGRLIFSSAINEKLQEWLLLKKPLSRAVDAVESVVRPAECPPVGELPFEPSSHQPTFDPSTQQDLEPATATEPAATVQEPPPPGCANTTEQSAMPALPHSNFQTPLEAVQQSLHSAVLGAARRAILDACVGQYLQDWIVRKESEKKALQAIRDNALAQEVEISTFETEPAHGSRTVQSLEKEEAAVLQKESEDLEASVKRVRHTKLKSQASDSEPQKKMGRKRLVKVVDTEVSQEASEAGIKSSGEADREQDFQLQEKKEPAKKKSRRRKKDDVEDHQPRKKKARKRLVNNADDDDSDSEVRGKLIGKETLLPELPEPLEDFRMEFALDTFREAEARTQGEASAADNGQTDGNKGMAYPEGKPDAEKPDPEEKLKKLQPNTRRKQTRKLPAKTSPPGKSESKKEHSPRQKTALELAWPDSHDCSRCFIDGWQWRDWSRSMKRSGLVSNQAPELERENVLDHTNSLQSARKNRAQRRNLAVAAEVNVSQLKARKKHLKFQRSKIHSWGLVALERIEPEDFVIEYVGEVVRSKVADLREKRYERNGMDSSYLFRIDAENVVDATKHGGLARFINHSCDPNCYTKIIHVEGQKRIFIYSKKTIEIGDELTYDYKFPLEEQKIPCFCGAARCRRYMN